MRGMWLLLVMILFVSAGFAKKKPNYKYKVPNYKAHPYRGKKKQHLPRGTHPKKGQTHARSLANKPVSHRSQARRNSEMARAHESSAR